MNFSKYRILLFDADDTILDFKKSETEAFRNTLNHFKVEIKDGFIELYKKINLEYWKMYERNEITKDDIHHLRFPDFFNQIGITGLDGDIVDRYYLDQLTNLGYILKNAKEVLEELAKTHELYLITNGEPKTQYRRMRDTGLDKYFKDFFISVEMNSQKPTKDFFDKMEARIKGFVKEEALIIGDSLTSDIKGGENSGIDTCYFNPDHEENKTSIKPTYEIDDLQLLLGE